MKKIAAIIPAYNESNTIAQVVEGTLKYLDCVVVVDDGSVDRTGDKLSGLPATILRNETNQGKAGSLWRGMQWALEQGADAVITLDGDTQHRPEDIPAFIEAWQERPDRIVIGSRLHDKDLIPVSRYRANRFANFWVAWASGYPIEDSQTGFRLYPAEFLSDLNLDTSREKGFVFESEILIEAGWRGIQTEPVRIPAIYDDSLRESHFQGVSDITKITLMISKRIISRGFYPRGLYRSSVAPALQGHANRGVDRDAMWMLLLSLTLGVVTLGVTHLLVLLKVLATARRTPARAAGYRGIVVLGHALEHGNLSSDYLRRLNRAIALLETDPQSEAMVVGGMDHGGVSEAEKGAEYLCGQGIDSDRITIAAQSINTLDNLREARPWISTHQQAGPDGSVVLVSNRYHLERIRTLAAGIRLPLIPIAAESRWSIRGNVFKVLIEMCYLHWYWTGRIFARLTGNQRMLDKIS